MKILTQLAKVMAEVGAIGKKTKAPGLNYAFRGIDAVVAEVQPLFAAHGIVMCSRVTKAERDTYETAKGSRMISVRLTVEHDFWCAEDGSKVTCVTIGEAMDTSDKASNKAMTAAEKYALTQTLKIPTYEADRDIEQANHQTPSTQNAGQPKTQSAPQPKAYQPPNAIEVKLREAQTQADLDALIPHISKLANGAKDHPLRLLWGKRRDELKGGAKS